MIKIELNNADNGVIKKVIDTQYNGVDQSAEIVKVYELDEDDRLSYYEKLVTLLKDISRDLGLDMGSDYEEAKLVFDLDWGDKYTPTIEDLDLRIKDLRSELNALREYKKIRLNDESNQ
jgi:hypothetical protein